MKNIAPALLALTLAACGGGGGSPTPANTAATPTTTAAPVVAPVVAPTPTGPVSFSQLPPAAAPVDVILPDWLISKSTSALTGVTTTILDASSYDGDFIIACTANNISYYLKTGSITADGAVNIRVGTNPVIAETWSESSGDFKRLTPATINYDLLKQLYSNWDFVMVYNRFGAGSSQLEIGSSGLSSAMDKTRADCSWPTNLFPTQNGWGKALPTTPPDDATEATNVSGLDLTKVPRMIAWRATNASGKPQILVRLGDAANTNVSMSLTDRRLYVIQDGKTVSAVSGVDFMNSASQPVILALNGAYDASRPLTLRLVDFQYHTTDPAKPLMEIAFP